MKRGMAQKWLPLPVLFLIAVIFFVYEGNSQKKKEAPKMDIPRSEIRPAALAGTWYQENPEDLRNTIDRYMKHAKIAQNPGTIIGLVAPHAGHVYSGPVAAFSYRQIQGKQYDTVIVIAPNHVDPRLQFSSVLTHGAYETPLGIIPVDAETARAIAGFDASDSIRPSDMGHFTGYGDRMEHALEIQLPFLQYALGNFRLVPIVMGNQERTSVIMLAKAIAAAVKGKKVLIVGSSDLSHFFPAAQARSHDDRVKQYIERYDFEGLLADAAVESSHVCGRGPIAVAMMACRELGATRAAVLHAANSGDITGDTRSVVGYLAAIFTKPDEGGGTGTGEQGTSRVGVDLGLTAEGKEILRTVVRQTLPSVVKTGQIPAFRKYAGKLGEEWGAFVTLTKRGNLRGCIGNITGTKPLIATVAEMTRAAALEDPRFRPIRPEELPDIEFEISVLTPIRRVSNVEEIVVGRDGIIITRGYNRGLLLPQVATEYGWDRETFLEQTCLKAGLPKDAWKDRNTIIEAFSAEVFH
jgi:AmmeMemoRadiSam system protein B/AmmeMemoRadiSam system protein A